MGKFTATLLLLLSLVGCILPPDPMVRRRAFIDAHPEIDSVSREAILSGRIWAGMREDEVCACLGEPARVEPNGDPLLEVWIYSWEQNLRLSFLYFEEGVLTHWTD
jgi:hypothetical protein